MGQSGLPPEHTYVPHAPRGSVPGGLFLQRPSLPLTRHPWQAPPQAESQQTPVLVPPSPSTQKPLAHSTPTEQATPASRFGTHCAPLPQKAVGLQSDVLVHAVGHEAAAPHRNRPHAPVAPGVGVQTPRLPTPSQRSQGPAQAELQHTPSTQRFERQSLAAWHPWPLPALPSQRLSALQPASWAQSVPEVQLVGHATSTPLQRYGAQEGSAPALPAARAEQTPLAGPAQVSHPFAHAVSQQTPSTQKPELH